MAESGQIKLKLSEVMETRGVTRMDLVRGADISYPTAFRLVKGEADAITFRTLANLCDMLKVEVGDLLVYEPE